MIIIYLYKLNFNVSECFLSEKKRLWIFVLIKIMHWMVCLNTNTNC